MLFTFLLAACGRATPAPSEPAQGLPADAAALASERSFTPDDIYAALKTYMPTGQTDPYIMVASGGQSGQVLVIGTILSIPALLPGPARQPGCGQRPAVC